MKAALIQQIDSILPQTQCTQCGYPDCQAYAEAIADGAPHNQCPPGGERVIGKLAELLKRETLPLNPKNGTHRPKHVANIREAECIGCVKCIKACPVDAIIGTGKMMHTVIEQECTGCDLCVPACPMDCIDMLPAQDNALHSDHWRERHNRHKQRLDQSAQEAYKKHQRNLADKKAYIADALARAKSKKPQK